jgi:REP-associated tyrosine transposase
VARTRGDGVITSSTRQEGPTTRGLRRPLGQRFAPCVGVPRGPRLDAPSALHHVMARGIDHCPIFRAETDRHDLVDGLRRAVVDGGAAIYGWSLMSNHFHLLIRTGRTPLSLLMRRLLTAHAVRFNHRYQRCGHLFQNRFKSTLVHDETYFLALVRYIHLNPLRAGVVSTIDDLDMYPWTGHRVLMSDDGGSWQSVADVLSCYGSDVAAARAAYRRFVADGIGRTDDKLDGGGFARRGNSWQMVEKLRRAREAWVPAERVLARPNTLGNLEVALPNLQPPRVPSALDADPSALVTRHTGVTAEAVAGASRNRSITTVRGMLAHVLVRRCGLSFNQTARVLAMSKWSVRRAVQRTEANREPLAVAELLAKLERATSGDSG